MVETVLFTLWIFSLGLLIGCFLGKSAAERDKKSLPSPIRTDKINLKFWKPIPVEPPKDYPVHSIPRTRGSWRKQKSALEAEHNSKQKELDALTGGI